MAKVYKAFTTMIGTTVLAIGLTTGAWAQAGGAVPMTAGGGRAGMGELEGSMTMQGSVVCIDCTLEEARNAHPNVSDLYQLTRATPGEGHIVMKVNEVNNKMWWETLVGLSHRLPVRAEDHVWKGLAAEENLFKNMQIFGMLQQSRVLDISEVKVGEQTPSELEEARFGR